MRIAVTGASGFIGAPVVRQLLAKGHELLLLQRNNLQTSIGAPILPNVDLRCPETYIPALSQFLPEVVCHLAWEGIPDFSEANCIKNLHQSSVFFDEILRLPSCKKIVSTGSCWEYGNRIGLCLESDEVTPSTAFAWAKQSLQNFGTLRANAEKKHFVWLRIFFAYGPRQRKGALIPSVLSCLMDNRPIHLSNPDASCDFIFVEDVAQAIVKSAETKGANGVFNIGSGGSTSVGSIASLAASILAKEPEKPFSPALPTTGLIADNQKALRDFGWQPATSLSDGIKQTIGRYFKQNESKSV